MVEKSLASASRLRGALARLFSTSFISQAVEPVDNFRVSPDFIGF